MTLSRSTVGHVLGRTRHALAQADVPDAGVEAELLVRHVLRKTAAELYASLRDFVPEQSISELDAVVARRVVREPLAYIVGEQPFFNRTFVVDKRVLIPRPESEHIVELAIRFPAGKRIRIADIGVGSGAIAVTLALEMPWCTVDAVDISREALTVTRRNVERWQQGERVRLIQGNLSDALRGPYDLVTANLPYVVTGHFDEIPPELRHEPRVALDGGPDGMRFVGPLLRDLPRILAPSGGLAILEIDPPLVDAVRREAARSAPSAIISIERDLAGFERYAVVGTRPGQSAASRREEASDNYRTLPRRSFL